MVKNMTKLIQWYPDNCEIRKRLDLSIDFDKSKNTAKL